jgi:hypothetical protein
MVSILDDLSKVTTGRADFVVAGNNIEELLDASTAHVVVKRAAELGLNKPGVSNMGGPYADGEARAGHWLSPRLHCFGFALVCLWPVRHQMR